MAERRKNRKQKDEPPGNKAKDDKPTKEEYSVAKWIRENVPSKKTKFAGHNVEYFTGSRAVDALLEKSPWNKSIFETREQIIDFLDTMLRHKFYHRAKKVIVTEEELIKLRGLKKKGKDCCREDAQSAAALITSTATATTTTASTTTSRKTCEKDKDKDKEKEKNKDGTVETDGKDKCDDVKEKEQKKKPKIRLEMHMEQYFSDCNDAYVWIYEPVPIYYWFFGALVVLGAIGVCLFPLWPPVIRHGVYYLSVAAAGFFVFILALALIRVVVFCIIWCLTFGRHHFWLLPNLIEDVGFFASFWPLYQYEYRGSGYEKKNKKKKRKKDKDSDCEDSSLIQNREDKKSKEELNNDDKHNTEITNQEDVSGEDGSESEKSNTGKDFEIVQHTELEDK